MTSYEILLMLDPDQAEARQDEIVARAREQVEKGGGTWQSHDPWGRRRLAYPIAKKEEGVYHLVVFDADGPTLDEVTRVLKIDDAVLRHMATRHIAGSRTGAPRDEGAAPVAAPAPAAPADEAPAAEAPAEAAPAAEAPAVEAPVDEAEADVSTEEEQEYAPTEEEPTEAPAEEEEE
ncbi:MAG: small subunit ribosomal protein [Gaiellaceae bacterium]|nr:small subunit ribosomal protein [Gaiellaceae bacterium]